MADTGPARSTGDGAARAGASDEQSWPPGLRGDVARLFSSHGVHEIGDGSKTAAGARLLAPIGIDDLQRLHELRSRVAEEDAAPSDAPR
ncbi:MAG TPA: hypothetical protein VHN37_10645 [Actinomycetota bacterium]|nr:hypothetical protein [Actinomycetota bacterium]